VTMNLRRYADFHPDPAVGRRELRRAFGTRMPDVLCVQEGLEGIDVFAELGYKRVSSSVMRSQTLRDSVYGCPAELSAVGSSSHGRMLVNELYVKTGDASWEAIDSGAAQISSDLSLDFEGSAESVPRGSWTLATRSAVWAKLQHRGRPAGPFVYVLNVQLSGGDIEDGFYAGPLVEERRLQIERVLELFTTRLGLGSADLGILAGDFRHSDPEDSVGVKLQVPRDAAGSGCNPDELYRRYRSYLTSPFNLLKERGWRIAYKQSQVGPTSPAGRLVDYIATSRAVSAKARGLSVSSGHMPSRATEHAALSDHNFVE
ncbi:unnamed protein product, partial [Polarella glacialis]